MTDVSLFFNPNHDARGRFTFGGGRRVARGGGSIPKWEGSDRLKAQQRLLMTASKVRSELGPGEKIALADYMDTFEAAHAINKALRGEAKKEWDSGKPQTTEFQKQTTLKSVHEFERIFDKTPVNETPLRLVRGIGSVGKDWGKPGALNGMVMRSDSLSSTTMDTAYAGYAAATSAKMAGKKPGKSVLMVMHAPEGTVRALPASDIRFADAKKTGLKPPNPGHEVILPPGTTVKVLDDVPASSSPIQPDLKVFDRVVTVEVLPEDPTYRQNFSNRDYLSGLLETVSLFYNPNHDSLGRFTFGPGGRGGGKGLKGKTVKPKKLSKGAQELEDLIKNIRAKNKALEHLKGVHDHYAGKASPELAEAVRYYEGSFARNGAMNDILRYGKIRDKHMAEQVPDTGEKKIREHVENLKGEFARAPKLAADTKVYRALRNVPQQWTTPVTRKEIEALQEKRFQAKRAKQPLDAIDAELDAKMKIYQAGGTATLAGRVLKDEGFLSTTADIQTAKGYLALADGKPAMMELTAPKGTPVIPVNTIIGKDGGPKAELLLQPGTSYRITGDSMVNGQRVLTGEIITDVSRETSLSGRDVGELLAVSEFFNPNHDSLGRFTFGVGGGGGGGRGRFSGGSVKVGGKSVKAVAKHSPEAKRAAELKAKGLATPDLMELDPKEGAAGFRAAMEGLKQNNRFAASVYVYSEAEYRDMRLFTSDDGKTGFALHGDEVVSVFTYRDSKYRGATQSNLSVAVQQGARRLDAFDTVLPAIYQEAGFEPVARVKWDDNYAPEGWDYETFGKFNGGRPDVVFMAYNKAKVGTQYKAGTGRYVNSYDDGLAAAKDAVRNDTPAGKN